MFALQSLAVRSLLPLLVASGPGVIGACAGDMSAPGAADSDGDGSDDDGDGTTIGGGDTGGIGGGTGSGSGSGSGVEDPGTVSGGCSAVPASGNRTAASSLLSGLALVALVTLVRRRRRRDRGRGIG